MMEELLLSEGSMVSDDIFDFLEFPAGPSSGLEPGWSDQAMASAPVDFPFFSDGAAYPLKQHAADVAPLAVDDMQSHPLSSPSPPPSSSSSPSQSPTSPPEPSLAALLQQQPRPGSPPPAIKSEPYSPCSPVSASYSRGSLKRQRASGAKVVKSEPRPYSDDDSSDEADFDPEAMPHPSIFSKTPSELSKEELLSLTTKGLEEYERRLKTFHTLTHSEQNQLKRQRRLIKNRESAQQSRMRKKVYVQDLERRVQHLLAEKDELIRVNQELACKNENLQRQINILQSAAAAAASPGDYLPSHVVVAANAANAAAAAAASQRKTPVPRAAVQTAGVCALVLLFSFALFLSVPGAGPAPAGLVPRSPTTTMSLGGPSSQWNTGRLLTALPSNDSIADDSDSDVDIIDIGSDDEVVVVAPGSPIVDITSLDDDDNVAAIVKNANNRPAPIAKKPAVVGSTELSLARNDGLVVRVSDNGANSNSNAKYDMPLAPSYIYCAEAQQLVPADSKTVAAAAAASEYPLISLLLPASAIDTSLLQLLDNDNDPKFEKSTLLEMSCRVLSLNVFPLSGRGSDFGVVAYQR